MLSYIFNFNLDVLKYKMDIIELIIFFYFKIIFLIS